MLWNYYKINKYILWRVGRGREPWERSEAGGVIGNERHLHHQAWSSLVFHCCHSSFNPPVAPPWDSRPVSGAGVVHYQLLHRPRSVPTALGPAPLVTHTTQINTVLLKFLFTSWSPQTYESILSIITINNKNKYFLSAKSAYKSEHMWLKTGIMAAKTPR